MTATLLPKLTPTLSFESEGMSDISVELLSSFLITAEVTPNDVLCGRGGKINSHPGNQSFRDLIREHQSIYLKAKKKLKPLLASSIVDIVHKRKGRFLKRDFATGGFYEIGVDKAIEKTAQALREGPLKKKSKTKRKRPEINSKDDDSTSLDNNAASDNQISESLSSACDTSLVKPNTFEMMKTIKIKRALSHQRKRFFYSPIDSESLSMREKYLYRSFHPPRRNDIRKICLDCSIRQYVNVINL